MEVDVTKENLCVNKIVGEKSETIFVESDVIIPDIKPDILNTIHTLGNVCIYKKEVLDGKVRIDGCVNVYAIYLADNDSGASRALNTSIDFTHIVDMENCTNTMSLDENITIKSIECKVLNGRKVNIKASLGVEVRVYSNEEMSVITKVNNVENMQVLMENLQMNSLIGEGTSKAYAKDTIVIDNSDCLAEILNVDIRIMNKDMKISYNKILAKADACVKIMYLTEDNCVKVVENTIPIMGFIDMPNVSEDNLCDTKYTLKNIIVKPNSVEEHSIYVEIEVEIYCRVYENKNIEMMQDLYSPTKCLNFTQKSIRTMVGKKSAKEICNIRENIAIPEIGGNQIYDTCVNTNIIDTKISKDKVMYEGELEISFIFASNNISGIDTKIQKIPFEFTASVPGVDVDYQIETNIEISMQNFVVLSDGNIDSKIDLAFNINMSKTAQINVIDDIKEEEVKEEKEYSMTIYFVKSGDTLWKIAKKLRSTVEDIARVNNIENENKIYPGQQLFIPKYV